MIFSETYIDAHYGDILTHERVIEGRLRGGLPSAAELRAASRRDMEKCRRHGLDYILIDGTYDADRFAEAVIKLIAKRP